MSEEMEEILPEEEEEVVEKEEEVLLEEPIVPEEAPITTEEVPVTTEEEFVPQYLGDVPEDIYQTEEQREDKAYQQSLDSRGYDPEELEKRNAADKEEALLNLMFKISEHPNGEFHKKISLVIFIKKKETLEMVEFLMV